MIIPAFLVFLFFGFCVSSLAWNLPGPFYILDKICQNRERTICNQNINFHSANSILLQSHKKANGCCSLRWWMTQHNTKWMFNEQNSWNIREFIIYKYVNASTVGRWVGRLMNLNPKWLDAFLHEISPFHASKCKKWIEICWLMGKQQKIRLNWYDCSKNSLQLCLAHIHSIYTLSVFIFLSKAAEKKPTAAQSKSTDISRAKKKKIENITKRKTSE